jgi:hypothetical protein
MRPGEHWQRRGFRRGPRGNAATIFIHWQLEFKLSSPFVPESASPFSGGQTESDLQTRTKLSAALSTVASHGHKITAKLNTKLAASTSTGRAEARKQHVSELQTKLSAALATQARLAETCEQPLLPPPVASAGRPDPSTNRPESVLPPFSGLNRAAKSTAAASSCSERHVVPPSSSPAPVPPAAFPRSERPVGPPSPSPAHAFQVHAAPKLKRPQLLPPTMCALAAGGPDPAAQSSGAQAAEPDCAQLDLPDHLHLRGAPPPGLLTKKYLHRTLDSHHTKLSIKPSLAAAHLSAEAQGKSGIPDDTYRSCKMGMIAEVKLKPPYCNFDVEVDFDSRLVMVNGSSYRMRRRRLILSPNRHCLVELTTLSVCGPLIEPIFFTEPSMAEAVTGTGTCSGSTASCPLAAPV